MKDLTPYTDNQLYCLDFNNNGTYIFIQELNY